MPQETSRRAPYAEMGLTENEYRAIVDGLAREPTYTELGMYAVLWSEHCSYKSSRKVLNYFKEYKGGDSENAGVVDIGDGIGIVFKVESHNHPSAVEPYEGAATGVGGIIRDILTMGARPIASLNSLRFGDITKSAEDRRLMDGVVRGIGGYGNCIGVPTVAGEVSFHPRYSGNPLVNAMCIGRVEIGKVTTAAAAGPGNPVLYLGSATGRDGIHGATFASEVLDEDGEDRRPNVQIGDPFAGKLLIEATLEALETGAIVAIQDMGAAGLTCSTCEMSGKGGVGMEIELSKVPLRDDTMSAYEIMLSESQERMLAVVEFGREREVLSVFEKWGLPATVIGSVTDDGLVTIRHQGRIEAQVPAGHITEGCPMLDLPLAPRVSQHSLDLAPIPQPKDYGDALATLLASPNIASKRWVFSQYDSTVQTQTAVGPGFSDAAVLALRGTKKGIATKIDCNARSVFSDPYQGGVAAVAEAARNVACTGARPVGATDCLNFGDPTKPEVFWQFDRAVKGIADACEALGTPVLSGNVSFYNETDLGEVLPTPTVGVVGILEDAGKRLTSSLPPSRGYIYLIYGKETTSESQGLGCSEYLAAVHEVDGGNSEHVDLEIEKSLIEVMVRLANEGLVACAHDISEGGIAVSIAEMAFENQVGCDVLVDAQEHYRKHIMGPVFEKMDAARADVVASLIELEKQHDPWTFSRRTDARLFGELPGRILVGVSEDNYLADATTNIQAICAENGLNLHCLGLFDHSRNDLAFLSPSGVILSRRIADLRNIYESAIPSIMGS
ncbi:MAG: phosphoribosylformylglycinamidine synthase subunit PurL [Armatimonadota bacterium]|nr:phosphoribosylformylglycinamidine synthase subunit PurL [Armatimonadota bacterium]